MISRDELRELASFECGEPNQFAISFYFEAAPPQDKSHRQEVIRAKDMVRRTLQELQLNGQNREAVADLERIFQLAESMHASQARTKAVFACRPHHLWREFDLPAVGAPSKLFVNRRFHLKPLAPIFSEHPRLWVALIDRQRARFLEIHFDQMSTAAELTTALARRGRSDGYAGYDGGHAQRHAEDEMRRHFRATAELLRSASERKQFETFVVGCQDVNWPDIESQLHPSLRKKLLGRFSADLSSRTEDQTRAEAERIVRESLDEHHHNLIREAIEEAKGHGRGVTGLRRVLRSVELGEVETILMARDFAARAVECVACRHLDSHLVSYCPLCGRATRQLEDVCEALVPTAIRSNIGLVLVPSDEAFDRVGNIAALLRFRADRNTNDLRAAS
jgi:peptide subunit release factor 1 (eRF1)